MSDADWKLKLRYGRLKTPYNHFTVFADGVAGKLEGGFECRPGPAIMAMRTWATDTEEAVDMACAIGRQIGFSVTGRIRVYNSEPEVPPGENPHGYGINFEPYGDA
jgi:hypothetical protein